MAGRGLKFSVLIKSRHAEEPPRRRPVVRPGHFSVVLGWRMFGNTSISSGFWGTAGHGLAKIRFWSRYAARKKKIISASPWRGRHVPDSWILHFPYTYVLLLLVHSHRPNTDPISVHCPFWSVRTWAIDLNTASTTRIDLLASSVRH